MAQRRHHYEQAFEHYLRARRIPYVAVDEAKKALLPQSARLAAREHPSGESHSLKSFDFVVYGEGGNVLLDIKGRKISRKPGKARGAGSGWSRLESWVTQDDVDSLSRWSVLFGEGFEGAFVFLYWCAEQPPDGLFQELFEHRGRWYAVRTVTLREYRAGMKVRSPRWRTVHLPTALFEKISRPFCPGPTEASLSERLGIRAASPSERSLDPFASAMSGGARQGRDRRPAALQPLREPVSSA